MNPALYPILFGTPAWVLPGASVDFDFVNFRAFTGSVRPLDSLLSVSRASVGYVDDLNGNWTAISSGLLRRSDKGALIEEARTNSIRNNSMQGAVAGSPGTLPTNWSSGTNGSGLAWAVVGTGTENLIDYIDLRLSGTAGSATEAFVGFEGGTVITASNGQTWAQSAFVRTIAGDLSNVTRVNLRQNSRTSGNASITNYTSSDFKASLSITSLGQARQQNVAAITDATVASVWPLIVIGHGTGAVDLTIRIGWPQLELGAFATSPIRTTNAEVTRAADVVTLLNPPVFGANQTLFAKGTPLAPNTSGANQSIFGASDGTANNRSLLFRNTSAALNGLVASGGTSATAAATGPVSQSTSSKMALAASVGTNAAAVALNGSIGATLASPTVIATSALTQMSIGNNAAGSGFWNGFVERVALWPNSRLSNAQLQALTA